MGARPTLTRLAAALAIALATVAAACTGSGSPGGGAADGGLTVLPATSALWPGPNRILLEVLDRAGEPLDATVPTTATLTGPDGERLEGLAATPVRAFEGARLLRLVEADVPRPGSWQLTLAAAAGSPSGTARLTVREDAGSPRLGGPAPSVVTPTAPADGVAAISSDPVPDPALYELSVADALAAGRPFVLVGDTYAVQVTQACGTGLALVKRLATAYPDVAVIHVEPYRSEAVDGRLVVETVDGDPVPAPWATAWGLGDPPWVVVVDSAGVVRSKLVGVMGSDELLLAIGSVSASAPSFEVPG